MKKKGFITEFREFIMRGNVLDMAIGVIMPHPSVRLQQVL